MNYTKTMIDLVREARKRVPSKDKPGIKLANPEVFDELARIYRVSDDSVLRAIVKELFFQAGEPWLSKLETKVSVNSSTPAEKFVAKVYRGKLWLEASPRKDDDTVKNRDKPKRVYRGRVVD